MHIKIGSVNWKNDLDLATKQLGDDLWTRFTPISLEALENLELQINQKLPDDFKEFYKIIGSGSFEPGNGFYSPKEIIQCIGAPIYFVRGSLMTGSEWATEEGHSQLWLSRGVNNPNSIQFTDDILTLNGIKLYDLLQFGADGNCGYHQLYVGPEPAPFRYCLLTDSGTIENKAQSFSIALGEMIEHLISEGEK
jgi:hypothetical protein